MYRKLNEMCHLGQKTSIVYKVLALHAVDPGFYHDTYDTAALLAMIHKHKSMSKPEN